MDVVFCVEVEEELNRLPRRERLAMLTAFEKLEVLGDQLPSPHSSAVKGIRETLRELRPRSGRSPWRAFYRRVGNVIVIGAIGPEATVNPNGFRRSVDEALKRLSSIEKSENKDG